MSKWAILAAGVLTLGAMASQAEARPPRAEAIVEGWYQHYLGRGADPCGRRAWACQLQRGASPDCVLSGILGSEEYYLRNGASDYGFIEGLYLDHLERNAAPSEVRAWLCELNRCGGGRGKLALKFLCAAKREIALRR